jgi:predicted nucleotidyltransferase
MLYTLSEIKAAVAKFAHENKIKHVYLFGSYANGCANEDSDIDLLVEYYETPSLLNFLGFQEQLQHELGTHVDILRYPINNKLQSDPNFKLDEMVAIYG